MQTSIKKVVVLTDTRRKIVQELFSFLELFYFLVQSTFSSLHSIKKYSRVNSSIYWDTAQYSAVKVD
jgi:hypothetical protein